MAATRKLAEILKIAQGFRLAIERTTKADLPVTLANFPNGSCGDAALLIGEYLSEKGFGDFNYVLGERGRGSESKWTSHAWIERNNMVVDITADQFKDAPGAVIVEFDSSWHKQFNGEIKNVAKFEIYDRHTAATLRSAYNNVVNTLGSAK